MNKRSSVRIVAPSGVVPQVELAMGVARLKDMGLSVTIHPQCRKQKLFFAGSDQVRAEAFFDSAIDHSFDVLWCARGGSGASRILPWLEKMTGERGIPEKKLLVGLSDITVLHNYVRTRWGWSTLSAPMPGLRSFESLTDAKLKNILSFVRGRRESAHWEKTPLKFFGKASSVSGEIVGGNLAVVTAAAGTPYFGPFRDKILFLEEVTEPLYRIDRMVQQLAQCGVFEQVRGIILGTFTDCEDTVSSALKSAPKSGRIPKNPQLVPLRKKISQKDGLKEIFGSIGECYKIPVAYGLPVGHGVGLNPLPLGADVELGRDGRLKIQAWDGWE